MNVLSPTVELQLCTWQWEFSWICMWQVKRKEEVDGIGPISKTIPTHWFNTYWKLRWSDGINYRINILRIYASRDRDDAWFLLSKCHQYYLISAWPSPCSKCLFRSALHFGMHTKTRYNKEDLSGSFVASFGDIHPLPIDITLLFEQATKTYFRHTREINLSHGWWLTAPLSIPSGGRWGEARGDDKYTNTE